MANYFKVSKAPNGGSAQWVDKSNASAILNNEFFGSELSTIGYIKVWTGGSWDLKPVKVWNGASWEIKPMKRWNGSNWI